MPIQFLLAHKPEYFELEDFSPSVHFLSDPSYASLEVFQAGDDHPGVLCSYSNQPKALSYKEVKGLKGSTILAHAQFCR